MQDARVGAAGAERQSELGLEQHDLDPAARERVRDGAADDASPDDSDVCVGVEHARQALYDPGERPPAAPRAQSTFDRNARVRSCRGLASTSPGGPGLDDDAVVHEHDVVRDLAREAHLVRDDDHRHPVAGESLASPSSTSPTSSGSSAEVGSSNSISFGSIASARAIATRCCWPPESCAG